MQWNSVLNLEKIPQKRIKCFRLLLEHHAWIKHQFLSDIRDSKKAGSLWGMMRGVAGVRRSIHQSWLAKGLGSGYYVEVLREFSNRFRRKWLALLKSLSSEAVVMRQLRRWKRLWRKSLTRSQKRTSMGSCWSCWNGTTSALKPEEITSKGTRVSCVYS